MISSESFETPPSKSAAMANNGTTWFQFAEGSRRAASQRTQDAVARHAVTPHNFYKQGWGLALSGFQLLEVFATQSLPSTGGRQDGWGVEL